MLFKTSDPKSYKSHESHADINLTFIAKRSVGNLALFAFLDVIHFGLDDKHVVFLLLLRWSLRASAAGRATGSV